MKEFTERSILKQRKRMINHATNCRALNKKTKSSL